MNKDIFKSYNYSLLTNLKKGTLRKIANGFFDELNEIVLTPEEINSLLIIMKEDCKKDVMTNDEFNSLMSNLQNIIKNGTIEDSKKGVTISYESIRNILDFLSKKRVNEDYNILNSLDLARLFKNNPYFDITILDYLLHIKESINDVEDYTSYGSPYSMYKKDRYLINIYNERVADDHIRSIVKRINQEENYSNNIDQDKKDAINIHNIKPKKQDDKFRFIN